jgi:hypothetical protein
MSSPWTLGTALVPEKRGVEENCTGSYISLASLGGMVHVGIDETRVEGIDE